MANWRERLRWPLPIALILTAAICLPLGAVYTIDALTIIGVSAAIVGLLLLLDAAGWTKDPILRPKDPAQEQVKRLLEALAEATNVISAIESEVAARSRLADGSKTMSRVTASCWPSTARRLRRSLRRFALRSDERAAAASLRVLWSMRSSSASVCS